MIHYVAFGEEERNYFACGYPINSHVDDHWQTRFNILRMRSQGHRWYKKTHSCRLGNNPSTR